MHVSWTAKARGDLSRIHRFEQNRKGGTTRRANKVVDSLIDESIDIDTSLPVHKGTLLSAYKPREVYRAIVLKMDYEMHYEIDTAQNTIFILDVWHTKENR